MRFILLALFLVSCASFDICSGKNLIKFSKQVNFELQKYQKNNIKLTQELIVCNPESRTGLSAIKIETKYFCGLIIISKIGQIWHYSGEKWILSAVYYIGLAEKNIDMDELGKCIEEQEREEEKSRKKPPPSRNM